MPPKHIAQTSTEAKKAYKKNGPVISERTHKQLQRGHELDQRAAREREAEQRRKSAKERREERERKEKAVRQQLGVGLATQMIGYSHTQARLKNGMEAFLGISKKRQDEGQRRKEEEKRREEELAKKLEVIAEDIEKEPFDDDDDMEDAMLDLPAAEVQVGGSWVDDELDDDTLLTVHDLVMSDPIDEPTNGFMSVPPRPATAPPTQNKQTLKKSQHSPPTARAELPQPPRSDTLKEDVEFTRTHGPTNRIVESALDKVTGEVLELLSQDVADAASDWTPAHGLLHKLNPVGLPPHRLRIKVGCVVICLRDLNTSSQLSKSQHVRILRVENERLECLTLDGQLAGTKTVITRVLFSAKYRNDDKFPFIRTQYPVRVATDYTSTDTPREIAQCGFKLPSIKGQMRPPAVLKRPTPPSSKPALQVTSNPDFKLPGLPASRRQARARPEPPVSVQHVVPTVFALDSWDDFLESGTQIARELSADVMPKPLPPKTLSPKTLSPKTTTQPSPVIDYMPPLSTQDLDFSLDDLDDEPQPQPQPQPKPQPQLLSVHQLKVVSGAESITKAPLPTVEAALPNRTMKSPPSVPRGPLSRTANIRRIDSKADSMPPTLIRPQKSNIARSKRPVAPPSKPAPPAKKLCVPAIPLAPPSLPATTAMVTASATATTTTMSSRQFGDFGISTQEVSSFFDDDDEFAFGSPPIAV